MTAVTADQAPAQGFGSALIHRQLNYYPETRARIFYLAIVVLSTITLYYELYVGGSVSTYILSNLGMSFTFYVVTLALGNLLGAFGSLFAGLTDRYGRANLVVFGLLFAGIFTEFVLPYATDKYVFTVEGFAVGIVEGICLVATPALIRDFSPQVGRAQAMGFWTSGPVIGSLIVSAVGSLTIPVVVLTDRFWTLEYKICGWVGLAVFVVALVGLRELSPPLRDQLMVTLRDRTLIEARAKGLNVEALLKNHWKQLFKADVVVSAVAVSLMLLIYYALVGFLTIYVVSVFGYSVNEANHLGYFAWGFNAAGVILVGLLSDKVRVRKPFMVIGGIGGAVMLALFLSEAKVGAHPSFTAIATELALLSLFLGIAFFSNKTTTTETVEHHNPAATATGLAIWGWIIRIVVFASFMIVPLVVSAVTPLVDYGSGPKSVPAVLQQYPALEWAAAHPDIVATATKDADLIANAQRLAPELTILQNNANLFAQAQTYPSASAMPPALIGKLITAAGGGATGIHELAVIQANQPEIQAIIAHQSELQSLVPYSAQLKAAAAVPPQITEYVQAHGPA